MKKIMIALTLFLTSNAYANESHCLARILYQESRGESVEGVATLGQTAVQLATNMKITLCKLERSGQVQSKEIPAPLLPAFTALANIAMTQPRLLSKGSDHWETGKKPHMPGKIKRVVGAHVFYQLSSN